jgi:hypothetical protein
MQTKIRMILRVVGERMDALYIMDFGRFIFSQRMQMF